MSKVLKLGISSENNKEIKEVVSIEVLVNKGVIGDRHFKDFNDPYCQLSLIESENIDYYNLKYGLNIPYVNFRRNIVTKNIKLNDLVGKTIQVGNIKLKVNDLCRPCKDLQQRLGKSNIIKEFLRRGGLRCEILSSGTINVGDKISVKA